MILYRVTSQKYLSKWQDAFSGEGSFRGGGRWSSVGTRMVYCSSHLSLATLEVLVHCNKKSYLDTRLTIRFELEDSIIQTLTSLPKNWDSIPESITTQRVGDTWIKSLSSMGLIVPSATLTKGENCQEKNVLLNPQFPKFINHIKSVKTESLGFDRRIVGFLGS